MGGSSSYLHRGCMKATCHPGSLHIAYSKSALHPTRNLPRQTRTKRRVIRISWLSFPYAGWLEGGITKCFPNFPLLDAYWNDGFEANSAF